MPDSPGAGLGQTRLSFAELNALTDATATRLAAGIRRRQVVALLAGNSIAYVQAVHAIARIGAVLLPLNVRLSPHELVWQLRDAGARAVLDEANSG
jgi:acyl-CoA synthetase (AMP-forming)/AMP-acid ligase II